MRRLVRLESLVPELLCQYSLEYEDVYRKTFTSVGEAVRVDVSQSPCLQAHV